MHEPRPPGPHAGEEAANSLETTLTELFAGVEYAVLCADESRRICFVNAAALALFGCCEKDMLGRKASEFYSAAAQDPSADTWQTDADTGHGYRRSLWPRRRCDGSIFASQTLLATLRDPRDGGMVYLELVYEVKDWSGPAQVLHALRRTVFDPALTYEARRQALLEFGCQHFGLAYGAISEPDGDELVVAAAVGPGRDLQVGQIFKRGDTYCDHTLAQNAVFRRDGLSCERVAVRNYGGRIELGCYIGCPVRTGDQAQGTIWFAGRDADGLFSRADLDLMVTFARCVGEEIAIENGIGGLQRARARLAHGESRDELTGLDDRAGMIRRLNDALERRPERPEQALSVALLAVDQFDTLDTRHGQGTGDTVLRRIAAICRDTLRESDHVGRWGADEFLLLLPDTTCEQARVTIERLLQALREPPGPDSMPRVTASAGVIEAAGEDSAQIIVHRADVARHLARSKGRDRVEIG
ncbi:sensor domain-containing diguanylate cyclase [uncultured Salinisphaera sp.]|uniref:sensor domain-containing diguanylate cyclase n=1 Tax=uncultured Salinisphaera sp. TaxID=359372 RepID=UPI0032B2DAFD